MGAQDMLDRERALHLSRKDAYLVQAERTDNPQKKGYYYCQAGVEFKRMGQISSAVGCYLRSLSHDWNGVTMYSLAKCLMLSGNSELAWKCYTVVSLMPNFNVKSPNIYTQCGYAVLATFEDEFVHSKFFLYHMYIMSGKLGPVVSFNRQEKEALQEVIDTVNAIGHKHLSLPIKLYNNETEFINDTVDELNKLQWRELHNVYLDQ